jgi:hypothetical protein
MKQASEHHKKNFKAIENHQTDPFKWMLDKSKTMKTSDHFTDRLMLKLEAQDQRENAVSYIKKSKLFTFCAIGFSLLFVILLSPLNYSITTITFDLDSLGQSILLMSLFLLAGLILYQLNALISSPTNKPETQS